MGVYRNPLSFSHRYFDDTNYIVFEDHFGRLWGYFENMPSQGLGYPALSYFRIEWIACQRGEPPFLPADGNRVEMSGFNEWKTFALRQLDFGPILVNTKIP